MKTVNLELKVPVLLVILPEGVSKCQYFHNWNRVDYLTIDKRGYPVRNSYILPEVNWLGLGKLTKLTEEQFAELVDYYDGRGDNLVGNQVVYKDYGEGWIVFTASESFDSAIEEAGYYWENPRDIPHDKASTAAWQAAQEKTLDRNRIYVFKKVM